MQRKNFSKLCMFFVLAATATFMLGGCSDGKDGAKGADGRNLNGTVSVANMTVDELSKLSLSSTNSSVTGVTINSPPVVTFTVVDANNKGVTGLGYTTKNTVAGRSPATNLVGLSNMAFTIAKLVPGTNGSPNKWVNYIVWSLPYTKADNSAALAAPSSPTTDNNGTLVDHGDGRYTYTFARDIKLAKSIVAGATVVAPNDKADLGDLTYEPNLPHRLAVQIGGTVRGTGTNNPDGTNAATGATSVSFANPINLLYDFIPATGQVVKAADPQREIVLIEKCNECHGKLAFHGGSVRVEAKYCVLCHTDQRKYGNAEAGTTATGYDGTSKTYGAAADVNTYKINGQAQGEFVIMVHRIHMSNKLAKTGYNYAGVLFDKGGYTQDPGLCRKCHDGSTKAPQGNNWKLKPSRLACGTCHDGINWSDGTGSTIADAAAYKAQKIAFGGAAVAMATSGHAGGAALNDSACNNCHGDGTSFSVEKSHMQANKTTNNPTIPAGAASFTYKISSVTVDVSNQPVVKFSILKDGVPVVLNTYAGATDTAAQTFVNTGLLTGFAGSPSFLVAYADGTDTVDDYNNKGKKAAQPASVPISELATGASGTLVNNGDGTYTATLMNQVTRKKFDGVPAFAVDATKTIAATFPVGAKLRSVALQGYFTQTDLVDYPYTPASLVSSATASGGLARHTISVVTSVSKETRRVVVDPAKCGSCHEWFEGHGGNRVYETQVCVVCHVPSLSSSGKGIDPKYVTNTASYVSLTPVQSAILTTWTGSTLSTYILGFDVANPATFPEAPQNFKDMIHGIHAGSTNFNGESVRKYGLQFVRDRASSGEIVFFDASAFKFPNALKNCEACHFKGTYATSKIPATALPSTNVTAIAPLDATNNTYPKQVSAGRTSLPNVTDLVTSPITAACVTCHDSAISKAHMTLYGGTINVVRSTVYLEQCNMCHGDGSDFDPAKVHNK